MNSCLYECRVMHRRLQPKVHGFENRIFLFWLDLDELGEVTARVPLFGVGEPNLYSLWEADYFSVGGLGLRDSVLATLRASGEDREVTGMRMLTLPRVCGYTFNPITIFFCYDEVGRAFASLIQVGNTFREVKPYVVPRVGGEFQRRVVKEFYVSPFSDLDLEFDFRFAEPADELGVWIDDWRGADRELVSALTGERVELTTANLLGMTLKYPFVTAQVIAGIHWEALKLWLKRLPFHRKEASPHLQRGAQLPRSHRD